MTALREVGFDLETVALLVEVEQFLYHEAALLDDREFDQWLALFTDDVRYWIPLRTNRYRREQHLEFSRDEDLALVDDDKEFLAVRVRRLATGMAWAEDPPSRTRHLITNVRVRPDDTGNGDYRVDSNFLVYRNRLEDEVDFYVGVRQDVLRRTDGGLRIATRRIVLDQNVLLAKNLSIFL